MCDFSFTANLGLIAEFGYKLGLKNIKKILNLYSTILSLGSPQILKGKVSLYQGGFGNHIRKDELRAAPRRGKKN